MATTTVFAAYADWDWDDESTNINFASKPGIAMVLRWLDQNDKTERNVEFYSPEGNATFQGLSILLHFLFVPIHDASFNLLFSITNLVICANDRTE